LALTTGARLGVYEVSALIGEGGMGQVYRARDTTLNRDVALKVLPDLFASDAERLARFTREAQTLAALNHPNIAHIHGLEENGGVRTLVMELVEGDDLSQRIARGPIPLDDALAIARQIAEALEAAHEQGIIHRDLKPANIKLRADDVVKVLDFGLAKAMESGVGNRESGVAHALANSPTITSPAMTMRGVILGTAAYMAPEQAKGKPVDKRADIWAFGCVVYEMLTGRRAFAGDDVSTTLAAVLLKEPDWQAVPAATPAALNRLLRRCLTKDPKARLRDVGEARIRIDELLSGVPDDAGASVLAPVPSASRRVMPWAAAGVLALGSMLIGTVVARRSVGDATSTAVPVTFAIAPPENTAFGGPVGGGTGTATQVAVSPDGRNIAFVAGSRGAYQIYLRPVASRAARVIPGTEGGNFPFWSPDSRFIGFFAGSKLKKVEIGGGGSPIVLCDAPGDYSRGGSWSRDNVILFAPGEVGNSSGRESLWRVSSAGGVPAIVTRVDPANADTRHRWPYFLPDGRHFIYTEVIGALGTSTKPSTIKIASLEPGDADVTLLQAESSAAYASGHLLFARDDTLMAQPFDPETRQFVGAAFPVAERVSREGSRYMGASVSENGTLVYGNDDSLAVTELTWRDRAGRGLGSVGGPAPYLNLALSPEERRVAVVVGTAALENVDIWIVDIARNVRSRLTVDPGVHGTPVWSPDGTRVAYLYRRSGKTWLRVRPVGGTSPDESLVEGAGNTVAIAPTSWSADGRYIAYTLRGAFPRTSDVWILPLFGERKPFPLVQTESLEGEAVFSPDGRWIAYTTDDSGQPNVFVQSFPEAGEKHQVSTSGGNAPIWGADGKGLYYLGLDSTLMAVPIDTTGRFDAGVPQALFATGALNTGFDVGQGAFLAQRYAVSKDGQRFLFNARTPQSGSGPPLNVVVNWMAAIQR
jgi:Tol biopolymer transport system component